MPHETQPDQIASDAQTTLDEIGRLQADRTHRDARRMFFVEGVRNVVQAIENGFRIETLVYSDKLLTVPIARRLIRDRRRSGIPTLERLARGLPPGLLDALAPPAWGPSSPSGGRRCTTPRREGRASAGYVLEAVRSEGNLGSLIRTSEAVGGAGFILIRSA